MTKTLEYISNKRSPVGEVGIEVEVERKPAFTGDWPHVRNWVTKGDGSLRNGIEYITRTPIKVDEKLEGRISALVEALKDNVVDDSARTSCHVHVNCLKLSPIEMVNGILSFWLTEEIISDYWGEERKGNQYCQRFSEGMKVSSVCNILNNPDYFNLTGNGRYLDMGRYYSCNLSAFPKHGSVEFRGMRGTIETKALYDWVRTVHHIMNVASKRYKTPVHLFENYMNTSNVEDFIKKIVGPYISDSLDFSEKKLDMVNDNAIGLARIVYMNETGPAWEKWEDELVKERSKRTTNQTTSTESDQPAPSATVRVAGSTTGNDYILGALDLFSTVLTGR